MSDASNISEPQAPANTSEIERGTYEILRDRLKEHASSLEDRAEALNRRRLEIFGGTEMAVIGNERIRTENNCIPRDIRAAGPYLLFGYNVFLGLKTETHVEDVLSLHTFEERDGGFAFEPVPADEDQNFLANPTFVNDFKELYKYYKDARLLQLRRLEGKLLAVFQTGASTKDIRVFRWAVDPAGRTTYIDNRGERDHTFPPSHDFEWIPTTREHHVHGRHPHVSILDEVFVETVGGDLTVKVEDNTEDGLGIYRELVDDANQSLDDAVVHYAKVGGLILLKILPYNETTWRYLVFNTRNQQVDRIDAIGQACLLLPEDHGLIFPGGYYLQSGESKSFEGNVEDMEFMRMLRSPNGEDVLYSFIEQVSGLSILLSYNMIRKEVENPIYCQGYSLFDDGRLVVFRFTSEDPTRVHPMQIWQTPYMSDEHAARAPSQGTFLEKVGNADLVRGISDALSICRLIDAQEPSVAVYEELIATTVRTKDAYYWLNNEHDIGDLHTPLKEIRATGELIIDEFEKVQAIKGQAREAVAEAATEVQALWDRLRRAEMNTVAHFVEALSELRQRRGHLITLRELRYVDLERLDQLEAQVVEKFEGLSGRMVQFLEGEAAFQPYHQEIETLVSAVDGVEKVAETEPIRESLATIGDGLELLTDVVGGLKIDDATVRTRILEDISEVMAGLNRGRAVLEARRKELASGEGRAEFGAQWKLLSQAVSGALAVSDTPEKCDEQLSKLLLQLEDLESRFGEIDDFLEQLSTKREDIYEAFSSKKQAQLDERQRRADRMVQAAGRILEGIVRRAAGLSSTDELNTYFVGDAMVAKVRDLSGQLRALKESVKADELDSRLKSAREDAARTLRDRQEIYEDGAEVIKLGRHRFSVNTQPFDLTLVPRPGSDGETQMTFHLTGTDFYEGVDNEGFASTREYWDQLIVSETSGVYRGEYLAAEILADAEEGKGGLSLHSLHEAILNDDGLLKVVRRYAAERYDEGYERGLHDQDTALILEKLLSLHATADLLRFAPRPRAAACLFWAYFPEPNLRVSWEHRAHSLLRLRQTLHYSPAIRELGDELRQHIAEFFAAQHLELHPDDASLAGSYLFEELAQQPRHFVTSAEAVELKDAFFTHLEEVDSRRDFETDLKELEDNLTNRHGLAEAWLSAFLNHSQDEKIRALEPVLAETVGLLVTERRLERDISNALSTLEVTGLLGQHPQIVDRKMTLRLDEFLARLTTFRQRRVPGFRSFQQQRHRLLERERRSLRLEEYKPKVMSAFVRNRLINEVYLPVIGDNLAKQMGTLGEGKRTDQMGLLLLISPPGYGKTTLMEYIANRLGLVFVKVNGPALGHAVTSLDPNEAPNVTARQEVEKINFALEMGNNVLLYLDDIQHTHSELLQKFISLCDAQRRIEGVWNGHTRTYDLKGKRFAVCMAGNPYTEVGEKFQVPDMLANRADTYNLGDILSGKDDVFALSYLENALTSNPILAPLTTRAPEDIFKLIKMAQGGDLQADQLDHGYSQIELEELLNVFRKLLRIQEVLLAINQQYIDSASQDDAYRTEPRFQLQGSYRNMNKLAEKVVPVMNEAELEALIDDHYQGESPTLTTGAEHNLLKLSELRGTMTPEEQERWEEIKRGFARVQAMGGAEDDPTTRVIGQLGLVTDRLHDIGRSIERAGETFHPQEESSEQTPDLGTALTGALTPVFEKLQENLQGLMQLGQRPPTAESGQALMAQAQQITIHLDRLATGLDALHQAVASRPVAPTEPTPAAPQTTNVLAPPPPPLDLSPYLDRLTEAMAGIATTAQPTATPPPPQVDLAPYLGQLNETLGSLAQATGKEIVQSLRPGVHDLLGNMANSVEEQLLPTVKTLGRYAKQTEDRQLGHYIDRALQQLGLLKDLVVQLRKIDTGGLVEGKLS